MPASLIRSRAMITQALDRHRWEEIADGAAFQEDGTIMEIGTFADLSRKHPDVPVIGTGDEILLPGFINGHHHVGLTPVQLGSPDMPLELWFVTRMVARNLNVYLDTLYSAFEMIASGITTVQHLHGWMPGKLAEVDGRADDVIRYDALGRITQIERPEDGLVTYSYPHGGATVEITEHDPGHSSHVTTQHWEAFGNPEAAQLAALDDAAGSTWRYDYDALGNLAKVTMPGGAERTWQYDSHGFLASETHPESGTTTYAPDAVGNIRTKVTAEGTIGYEYDHNNRLHVIDAPGTDDDVTFTYDANDNRKTSNNAAVETTFIYDTANRLAERHDKFLTVGAQPLVTQGYAYDASDHLIQLRLVDQHGGRDIRYGYPQDQLTGIQTAVDHEPARDVVTNVRLHANAEAPGVCQWHAIQRALPRSSGPAQGLGQRPPLDHAELRRLRQCAERRRSRDPHPERDL